MIVCFFLCCFLYTAKLSHLRFRDAERSNQFHKSPSTPMFQGIWRFSRCVEPPKKVVLLLQRTTFMASYCLRNFLINYVHAISRNNLWNTVNSQLCLNFSNVYSRTQLVVTSLTNIIQIHFHLSLLIQTVVGQETKYIKSFCSSNPWKMLNSLHRQKGNQWVKFLKTSYVYS